jgi:hypothetical protein
MPWQTGVQAGPDFLEGKTPGAVQADRPAHVAVELEHHIVGDPRLLMEIVDILGNNAIKPSQPV